NAGDQGGAAHGKRLENFGELPTKPCPSESILATGEDVHPWIYVIDSVRNAPEHMYDTTKRSSKKRRDRDVQEVRALAIDNFEDPAQHGNEAADADVTNDANGFGWQCPNALNPQILRN